jgi:hypothetical protein
MRMVMQANVGVTSDHVIMHSFGSWTMHQIMSHGANLPEELTKVHQLNNDPTVTAVIICSSCNDDLSVPPYIVSSARMNGNQKLE